MQNELIEQGNCSFGSFLETTDVDQLWTSFPVMHVCATVQDKVAPMLSTPRFTTVFSLLPAVVVTGAYSVGALFPLNNPDTYGHLAQGRQIASSGFVPRHDTFSFWEGKPDAWNNYEWLSDYLLWEVYAHLGADVLVLGKCLLAGALGFLMFHVGSRFAGFHQDVGSRLLIAAALVASLAVVRVRLTVRPHLLGYVAFGFLLYLVSVGVDACARGNVRRLRYVTALSVLLHVAWVNLHGSHLLGLAVVGAHLSVSLIKSGVRSCSTQWCTLLLVLQILASGISPFGYAILLDAIEHVIQPEYRALVSEWGGWSENTPLVYVIAWWLCGVGVAVTMRAQWSRGLEGAARVLILLGLLWMAYRSVRFTSLLVLTTSIFVVPVLASIALRQRPHLKIALGALLLGGGALASITMTSLPRGMVVGFGESQLFNPHACTSWLAKRSPDRRLYAAMDDGWYALFASPKTKVILDGRVPYYGIEHVNRVAEVLMGRRSVLEELDIVDADSILIRMAVGRYQQTLSAVHRSSKWDLVCVEDRHALFLRHGTFPDELRLRTLPPRYDTPSLLASIEREGPSEARKELAMLSSEPSAQGYRAWAAATTELGAAGQFGLLTSGLDVAEGAKVQQAYRSAQETLQSQQDRFAGLPSVQLMNGALLSALCRLDKAGDALEDLPQTARATREGILLDAEVSLRSGDRRGIDQILSSEEGRVLIERDKWLQRLSKERPGQCAAR